MKKRTVISLLLIISMLCSGCFYTANDIKKARSEAYESGYENGLMDGGIGDYSSRDLNEAYEDGYRAGKREASDDYDYIVSIILEEAKSYARGASDDITLLDAMDIVSVYLEGYDPSGYPLPSRNEFEEAVNVLLHYAVFLEWNESSYTEILENYDPFYG